MNNSGAIIALAFPDVFVRVTDGKYNIILEKLGMVNADLIRAGHAAALIVEPDGHITYTDFGRYITYEDQGRARTKLTDPDVHIPIRAKFTDLGTVQNLKEIMEFLRLNPELTHADGRLYAGLFYNVNTEKALEKAEEISLKGSMPYGPFVANGSNCARYVWSLLWHSGRDVGKLRLFKKRWPSPMPLDLIMCAEVYHRFELIGDVLEPFSARRWPIWNRLFEKPESRDLLSIEKSNLYAGKGTWLESIGDGAWFEVEGTLDDQVMITRRDSRGVKVFSHWFQRPSDLDLAQKHQFEFDCNAQFCHISQNGRLFRLDRVSTVDAPVSSEVNSSY